jgi:acyl-CoA thioesterase-1
MYGTNDSYVDKGATASRLSKEQYTQNLRAIVSELRQRGITVVLMTEPRWGDKAALNGVGENPNIRLEPFVAGCRIVANELRVPLVDHFQRWSEANAAGTDIGTWTTDECHPNPAGHQILADTVLPVLLESMKNPAQR